MRDLDRESSMHMLQRRIQHGAGRSLPDAFQRSRAHNILPEMRSESHSEECEIRQEVAPGRWPDHMVPEAWSSDVHGDGYVYHRISKSTSGRVGGSMAADQTVERQPDPDGLGQWMVEQAGEACGRAGWICGDFRLNEEYQITMEVLA